MSVESRVLEYCDAIHTQDPEHFRSLWAEESPCTLISIGTIYCGYDAIFNDFLINGIQANYETIDLIPEDITVIERYKGRALVTFRYHTKCIRRSGGSPFGIEGVETQVWAMEDDWRLIYLHYSKI